MPIRFEDIQQAKQRSEARFEPAAQKFEGVLVGHDYTTSAKARHKPGYVWYRGTDQGNLGLARLRNPNLTPPTPALPVILQRDTQEPYEVVVIDWNASLATQMDDYSGETPGTPRTYTYLRDIGEFLAYPGTGVTINVAPLLYSYNRAFVQFPGHNAYSLSGSLPGAGLARYSLVYINKLDNTLTTADGATTQNSAAVTPALPSLPANAIPVALVRLYNGETQVAEADILDPRPLFSSVSEGAVLGNVISAYLTLPGLRGFWPMSSFDDSGNAIDLSGQGRDLTYNGNPTYNVDGLAPYIDFDGTGDYLSRADEAGLQPIGDESYVASGLKGVTIGGWFYPDSVSGERFLIGKNSTTASERDFEIVINAADDIYMGVLAPLGGGDHAGLVLTSVSAGAWQFFCMRWTSGVGTSGWINDSTDLLADTSPTTIRDSVGGFGIGAYSDGTTRAFDGRASMCFLCAAAVPDATISELYQLSRGLFGV